MKRTKSVLCLVVVCLFAFTSMALAQEGGDKINRLDFTKQVLEICGIQSIPGATSHFKDIENEADAAYVEAAYQNKIVSGYQNCFYPQNPVTKEEAITIVVKALGEKGVANRINSETADAMFSFQDKHLISNWAKPYVAYAVEKGMISENTGVLNPCQKITINEADQMLQAAKKIFIRDGLTAYQMLQKADQNLNEFDSYKFKGEMEVNTNVSDVQEQPVHMEIAQEGVFKKPEKVYVKSVATAVGEGAQELEDQKQESEVLMDNGIMYIKTDKGEKWLKFDTNPFMQEVEKLIGNQNTTNGLLSQEQMELFGMYAAYDPDIKIADKDYYVLNIDLDYNTFKEIYKGLLDKMSAYVEAMVQSNAENAGIPVDMQEVKKAMTDMIQKMDIEVKYKYYIDKQTKQYQKMQMSQNMNVEAEGTTVQTKMQGEYTYYDFGKDVNFPQIDSQDTQTISDLFNDLTSE